MKEAPNPLDIHGLIDLANLGEFRDEVNEAIKGVVAAVQTERGKGKVTITFDVNHDDAEGVLIRSTVATKAPKREVGKDHLFADPTGRIFAENPNQTEMNLGEKVSIRRSTAKALGVPEPAAA